jgi:fatty acid desaturase
MRDPRVRAVPWRDLSRLSRLEAVRELALPLPWLALEVWLTNSGHVVVAAGAAFMFFLACLRVAHDVFHANLRLPRWADHVVLAVMSPAMLGSLHAVRVTHLRHHTHCMDDDDAEAASARATAVRALMLGPMFALRTHAAGLAGATREQRRVISVELAACAAMLVLAFTRPLLSPLSWHVVLMVAGQCLAPFFAVWTVHRGCDRSHFIARTLRNRVKSLIVLDMFYHVEHHLFPRVPTKRLPELARRLDHAAPELATRQVY